MNFCRNRFPPSIHCEAELRKGEAWVTRLDAKARRLACGALGRLARIPTDKNWIQFLLYHYILDDQRQTFRQQLLFLRQHGDFIGLDDAVAALRSGSQIGGRYFCLTFDDGFRNGLTNAMPILQGLSIPAAFFISTKYIGLDLEKDWEKIAPFYERSWTGQPGVFEFLNWDECRQIAAAGHTIGSHTYSHQRLTHLQPDVASNELLISKQTIETELSRPCRHFCCPWGKVNRDFDPAVHPPMAHSLGYDSFLTAEEGLTINGDNPFYVRRTACEPDFHPSVLRYSLFSPSAARRVPISFAETRINAEQNRRSEAAGPSHGSWVNVSEPELVQVGKFPYPFEAAFTVASDIDSASLNRFRAVHALFCGEGEIRSDSPEGRTLGLDAPAEGTDYEPRSVWGLGLDLADSFFLVGDKTTFGMYRYRSESGEFRADQQDGEDCGEVLRRWIKAGQIDSFHAFLHHTRAEVVPLLQQFYSCCEREGVPKPKVWINHSLAVTPTGLCPRRLQPDVIQRLIRLTGRKVIGPMLGRQPLPLSSAFARYQGDSPASPHYVNDILATNGLRYVWLNMDDLHRGRIVLPEQTVNGRPTILQPVTMEDGARYYRFDRCYGKASHQRGGEAYLRDSVEGFDSSQLINESNLELLCRTGGTSILYSHWTHPRSFPISKETISRFELLRRWRDAGRIWVTSTAKLLEWTRRRTFLRLNCRRAGQRLTINIGGVDDPIFGQEKLTLADLDGLCLHLPKGQLQITVAIHGQVLNARQVHFTGEICWLDAGAGSNRSLRTHPASGAQTVSRARST